MVQCTMLAGCETTMKHTMDWAREAIDLQEIGVQDMVIRRTMTGGILLRIKGPDRKDKAKAPTGSFLRTSTVSGGRMICPGRGLSDLSHDLLANFSILLVSDSSASLAPHPVFVVLNRRLRRSAAVLGMGLLFVSHATGSHGASVSLP